MYLFFASSLVMAESGLRFESIEVKITGINLQTHTVDYIEKNTRKTMKIDEEVLEDGYYISGVESKTLATIKLNRKYFIRIAYNENIDENKKDITNSYVSFISTVPYDTLY